MQRQHPGERAETLFEPVARSGTNTIKWEEYAGRDIIPLGIADTDFRAAPCIIEALQERLDHGVFGYTRQPIAKFRDVIVQRMQEKHNWSIEPNWIIALQSIISGLNLACLASGQPGDSVLSPTPIYPPFLNAPANTGRDIITVPHKRVSGRWVLDFDTLKASITPNCKLVLFCNPQNPGGTVYRRDELFRLHSLCKRHDLIVCSDEIHCDLIYDSNVRHIPFASLNNDARDRTITLMSAGKSFNTAGLGCSFAIIPSVEIRDRYKRAMRGLVLGINVMGQIATVAAFEHGQAWFDLQLDYLRNNRDLLVSVVSKIPGLSMQIPEATFLAWIDISALNLSDPKGFFEDAGVGISPGAIYGDNTHIRLNFGCDKRTLNTALSRIERILAS